VVALAVAPGLVEPFTSTRWYALTIVAAGWLVTERLACQGRGLPSLVRRTWIGWFLLAAWVAAGSLRHGPAWAMAPLLAWAGFGALVLAACWSFRRQGLSLGALRGSVSVVATIVILLGLLQMAGLRPLPWLPGGDGRSATFGNVNMAAQFVGLALVVLFSRASGTGRAPARRAPLEVLGLGGLAYIALAGTRSVALALVAAFAVLALVRRSRESLTRTALAVAVAILVFIIPVPSRPEGAATSKETSARWRLAVWADTLDLVGDRPLGVGAGNFEHAFIPYSLAGRSRPGESLFFRSPHNEFLKVAAEQGAPGTILLLGLLLLVVRGLNRSPTLGGWGSEVGALLASCGAFLAVEACFQFPFEIAFPSFLSAVLFGLALAAADPGASLAPATAPPRGVASLAADGAILLVAGLLLAGTARVAVADHLFATRRGELSSLERACRLDPRRLDACVEAAWHHSRAGRHGAAQAKLAEVLSRSPAYYPALKLRAEDLVAAGHREEGCARAREYDALFGGASSLGPLVLRECGPAPGPGSR
jgi:O-antigen ligase